MHISGISQEYLRHISDISHAYILNITGSYLEYLRHMLGISQVNTRHLSGISQVYLRHILGISQHFPGKSQTYLRQIPHIQRYKSHLTPDIYPMYILSKSYHDLIHIFQIFSQYLMNISNIFPSTSGIENKFVFPNLCTTLVLVLVIPPFNNNTYIWCFKASQQWETLLFH